MRYIRISDIKVSADVLEYDKIIEIVKKKTGINKYDSIKISKKSIDARDKSNVHYVYSFDIYCDVEKQSKRLKCKYSIIEEEAITKRKIDCKRRPIVVGAGPAGLFAALELAECGANPIIVERGKMVRERSEDVKHFWKTGKLLRNSNALFGEGGAGTFSDGKLTTGIKDVHCKKILKQFVEAGATEDILYLAKPHIGTDILVNVVQNIRNKIIQLGGKFMFETLLTDIIIESDKIAAIEITSLKDESKSVIQCDNVILALGHSARDTFDLLHKRGVKIIQKPFSVGVRIEHKSKMINISQYGESYKKFGAADYKLAVHGGDRSAYTFCMCPGGYVTACSSEHGGIVTNGMSEYARNGENSNAALLVGVSAQDFENHPLGGIYFQQKIEKKAFEVGGSNYSAPVQLVGDFLKGVASNSLGDIEPTYKPSVMLSNLSECFPDFITETLKYAIIQMDKKLKGFATHDAVLTGVETRSSSPIRIVRDADTFQSNISGLYPCGEGAGYAGGIMSAAADGIKCSLKIGK